MLQIARICGSQPGDVVFPFGGVFGDGKGAVNLGKTIWTAELDSFQLSTLCSEVEKHKAALWDSFTNSIVMRQGHMLMKKEHTDREDVIIGPEEDRVHYMLPKQFFVPEDGDNRTSWNKVFGGAAKFLVSV